ncbi:glycoside hydrolase [Kitasatospora sp. NPDC058170]|uniref:glycoside hydrolase n=1 Tax=Kitasatospora sp. NPDC058170 TaxID=3346364 RepID=UPI0036DF3FCE
MISRRGMLRALAALPAGAAGVALGAGTAHADFATVLNPATDWGPWEGWGTSLGWWAKHVGPDQAVADALFGRGRTELLGQTVPGLGLNIVRYNAGASGVNSIDGRTMQPAPVIDDYKHIEGYQLDWYDDDPGSASWNWNADARQRDMMWLARDRGADVFELFSNSPMWWMLKNNDPFGADDGSCNLNERDFGRHAAYLATVARYAHDHWGIDFSSVQPVNEPGAAWGGSWGHSQEGCYFSPAQQAELIAHTRSQLDVLGLGWMQVAGLDEYDYDTALYTWNAFDDATRQRIGKVNVHGYARSQPRDQLYAAAAAAGKRIWQSEYTDWIANGFTTAESINRELHELHPTAFVYWQIADSPGYGAIELDGSGVSRVNTKFFVLAQYTRHIRPGMLIIETGHPDVVAAYDDAAGKLVVVAVNRGDAQWIDIHLSLFGVIPAEGTMVDRWCTEFDGGRRYEHRLDTRISGTRFWSQFPARSVQTFEISGIRR